MPNDANPLAAAPKSQADLMPATFTERDQFELDLRKAKVFAASTLVPAQYQDNLPNCLIALNMAKRIGADALMVCQNLHIVQGKPGWSGQFLIATFNQCGRFTSMRFEWRGAEGAKDWACRAYATEKATGEKIVGAWITWKMVEGEGWSKKNGSKWLTMPEQMFCYRAAAFLVRAYAPEIAMGLQTVEELADVIDITPSNGQPAATRVDGIKEVLRSREEPTEPAPVESAAPETVVVGTRQGAAPTHDDIAAAIDKAQTASDFDLAGDLVRSHKDDAERGQFAVRLDKRRDDLAAKRKS